MSSDERFHVHNTNEVHGGDVIQQYGAGSVGKQVHTGAGDNVLHKTGRPGPVSSPVVVQDGDYVAQDKTTHHLGDFSHNPGQRPDVPSAAWKEEGR